MYLLMRSTSPKLANCTWACAPRISTAKAPTRRSHMDRPLGHGERCLLHRLGEGRMRVAGARQILRRAAELHDHRRLRDHLAGVGADDMHAQNAVGGGI